MTPTDDEIIGLAKAILSKRLNENCAFQDCPTLLCTSDVIAFLQLQFAQLKQEQFGCLFLNKQLCVVSYETLFQGSISDCTVYPREVVRQCLDHNATAVIFAHNHPSGNVTPSAHDVEMTKTLREALALIEVTLLDHVIVGGTQYYSMQENNDF